MYALYHYITGDGNDSWLSQVLLWLHFDVLEQIEFRALAAAAVAFVLVILFGRRVIDKLTAMKIGDAGMTDVEALRDHSAGKANTPTMGGVLIVGSIVATCVLLADLTNFYVLVGLVVLLWLAVLGGVDDWLKLTASTRGVGSRQGLHAWEKLVFQLGLGLLVGYFIYRHGDSAGPNNIAHVLTLPFQRTNTNSVELGYGISKSLIYLPQFVFIVVAVLMVAGMSNAVNLTDGMDGLATGVTSSVSLGLLLLVYVAGVQAHAQSLLVPHIATSVELTVLSGAMLGSCLGFLWWNCAPAQVFMGDTGSLALGGLIAYIAVVIRQEIVVLLMSGVFLVEIGSVVAQVGYFKYSGGKRILRCAPYHHHLHLGGWTEQKVVIRLWIVSIVLLIASLVSLKLR
jgi:phospho-N-acetylmuramoyl-pentapeptide-transferase